MKRVFKIILITAVVLTLSACNNSEAELNDSRPTELIEAEESTKQAVEIFTPETVKESEKIPESSTVVHTDTETDSSVKETASNEYVYEEEKSTEDRSFETEPLLQEEAEEDTSGWINDVYEEDQEETIVIDNNSDEYELEDSHEHDYVCLGWHDPVAHHDGWWLYECSICGDTYKEPIPCSDTDEHFPEYMILKEEYETYIPEWLAYRYTSVYECPVCGFILEVNWGNE